MGHRPQIKCSQGKAATALYMYIVACCDVPDTRLCQVERLLNMMWLLSSVFRVGSEAVDGAVSHRGAAERGLMNDDKSNDKQRRTTTKQDENTD
jgi:hypothetical protein